jgi:LEA14-like dessication related protein
MIARLTKLKSRHLLALLLPIFLLAACGPQLIEGRPPFVSISSMALKSGQLSAEFDIRNENEVSMNLSAVEITVTVENSTLVTHRENLALEVGASSSERIHVDQMPEEFTRSLLESVQSGERKSLAFDVEGSVQTLEDGRLSFAHKGYLYPVPGRPGEFRAAVTQAEGLTREKFN